MHHDSRIIWNILTPALYFLGGIYAAVLPVHADEGSGISPERETLTGHESCKETLHAIRVTVSSLETDTGSVIAEIYPDDPDGFLRREGRIDRVAHTVRLPETAFCISAPGPGFFAVAVYHDRNGNGKFDKTFIGLPAEPWGLSNNPSAGFSLPKLEKSLFEVTGTGADLDIRLN